MSAQMLAHKCLAWPTTARLERTQMTISREMDEQNVVYHSGMVGYTSPEAGGL